MRVRIPASGARIVSGLVLCAAAALLVTTPAQAAGQAKSASAPVKDVSPSHVSGVSDCYGNWTCWS
ncbi:hypothetical protein ABZY05_40535 [Streptomyces canus]|uniref:hypothetical protein n=1 Tax=Streptomyces canus TaxID=58343 RepID=UPI00339FB502